MLDFRHTKYACYLGYFTQAAVNNFAPLLFVTFHDRFGISTGKITLLITLNFLIQLTVDLASAKLVDKIGYRRAVVAAHICASLGLVGLAVFPFIIADAFTGLLLAVALYAIGGGVIEVVVSPIIEAVPADDKASEMSLLHSFYCWGTVFVILVSACVFAVFGVDCWPVLACIWASLPLANAVYFAFVPIRTLDDESGEHMPIRSLLSTRVFWIFAVLMLAAGASEQGMVQWASIFAERGLGVPKTVGDIVGPCLFSVLMGGARVFFAKKGEKIDLLRYITASGVLCVLSYICAAFAPVPAVSLFGCAICGLSVGIMWPGVFSVAAVRCRGGGTAMFALLALAGDLGCAVGPSLVGFVSSALGDTFSIGLAAAAIFPAVLAAASVVLAKRAK